MKIPRVEDFDPNTPQLKKQPELKSSFEGMPSIENHIKPNPQERKDYTPTDRPTNRLNGEPVERRHDRPTGRRIPVRRGFEFYEDQLVTLKKISLQEQLDGKPGNMSQMVREALDEYLKKRTNRSS